jgi:hypothetical protein
MRVSSRFVIDVSCTPEHSPARSASQKTQRISISSMTQTAARLEVIKILAALSDRAGKPNSESSGLTADHPTSGRDFFSTHFDINYLPENQARTEALWETSENGGRAAYHGERRVTFEARFCGSRREVCFQRGSRSNQKPYSVEVSGARFCQ